MLPGSTSSPCSAVRRRATSLAGTPLKGCFTQAKKAPELTIR
jgi:hypothetical protein